MNACCMNDTIRRTSVRKQGLNGLDAVEVDQSQTRLSVSFLGRAPDWITPAHLAVTGGRRERGIQVLDVRILPADDEGLDDQVQVTVDRPGDFSTYRLEILDLDAGGRPTGKVPQGFDPRYAAVDFSFKLGCPSDQDPADQSPCPRPVASGPVIDYLAKDYQGFRQLILDRLALTLPDWSERRAPDLGITLVEILAYVANDLSYYQDAVATEAFLASARLRESVRRHCRLVDYRLNDGRNARGWARFVLEGAESLTLSAADLMLTTALPGQAAPLLKAETVEADLSTSEALIFEPAAGLDDIILFAAHNHIAFYDWGEGDCCLPAGATAATLLDPGTIPDPGQPPGAGQYAETVEPPNSTNPSYPAPGEPDPGQAPDDIEAGVAEGRWHQLKLAAGDVLIVAEVLGPRTGVDVDADPSHRQAVRLTAVRPGWDPLTRKLVLEVEWCPEDALSFPLCLSARAGPPSCEQLSDVSVAYGNIVAVDHGRRVEDDLGVVGVASTAEVCDQPCHPAETAIVPRRFRPSLPRSEPTFVAVDEPLAIADCGGCGRTAAASWGTDRSEVSVPAIVLTSHAPSDGAAESTGYTWLARSDLLDSGPGDRGFVLETDAEGGASLRFGDGVHGRRPAAGETFRARYRVGSGPRGNVGADALAHVLFRNAFPDGVTLRVSNPLAMRGGGAAETVASAKLRAPQQFRRRLERAITADDYATIVMRDFSGKVQRAAASLRATGVRTEVCVAVDQRGQEEADPALLSCIADRLEACRRIGHDVRVVAARSVPIDLALTVCVAQDQIAEHVKRAVADALSAGRTRAGALGFFHPDALSFGQPIALSRLVAAVHAVEGVAEVEITRLCRLFETPDGELETGLLPIRPQEIARLDQDPDAPEAGRLALTVRGGR